MTRPSSSARFSGRMVRLVLLFILCLQAHSAWAMRCVTSAGADKFIEPIGSVQSYPVNVPDGYIIWISPTRTTTGYCYKDLSGPGSLPFDDPVSFYANPANIDPAVWGLEIGIRYQGVDYFGAGSAPGQGVPTGNVVPACSQDNFNAGLCPKIPVSITYQVVVRKRGAWVGIPQDTYTVFQFDGKFGINCCNTSFQYILSGLENLKPTPCTVDVTVNPEPGVIDFGQVQRVPTGFSPVKPTRPFSLALDKTCNESVQIGGYFETSNPVQNNLILPEQDSQFGIGIQDRNGQQIPVGEPFPLATFTATQAHIEVPMTATLQPLGTPKIGPFNAVVTVRVLYD
ncbi:fimbrial protein [Paraburkholderia fungorum]|uniref:Fimbrial protein n=2 Tax=Paraburkholderia fungorum TaxID=134537 RepID=A0A420GW73_9BURK|nr:fimbrial protein [Paraburkholderia fungorum]RKF49454.1 fimbrial protein [Paraburkholderia fungorum]